MKDHKTITCIVSQVPEGNETLTVQLTTVSGDGRLAAGLLIQASLTILHNDDQINFDQSVLTADEGDRAIFTINRGGQANGVCVCVCVCVTNMCATVLQ